jgi:hypothetical protein
MSSSSYSDTGDHSPSNYSGSYPSLSDSASSLHLESDMHPYESPKFGIYPRQHPHRDSLASTSLPAVHLSNPTGSPQNFQNLQEYIARLEKDHRDLEQKHLLLETQHKTLW